MNTKTTSSKLIPVIILLALVALAVGIWFGMEKMNEQAKPAYDKSQLTATIFDVPRAVSEFTLTDNTGQPFTQEDFKGHWNILFFGFTHCKHICPPFMRQLNEIYQKLAEDNYQPLPQVIFVSVDPARDTPERMDEYVKTFNPNFRGVTGDKTVIDQLANELSVLYFTVEPRTEDAEDYDIEHSGAFMIIDPDGNWHALFTPPHDVPTFVEEYKLITSYD